MTQTRTVGETGARTGVPSPVPDAMIIETGLPDNSEALLAFLIPRGVPHTRVKGIQRAEPMLARAGGLVLGVAGPNSTKVLADVHRVRRIYPWLPIVVAGPIPRSGFDFADRLALHDAGADSVISWSDSHFGDGTLAQAWGTQPLKRLAATVQRSTHLADLPRALMVRALASSRPLASVAELATMANMHRTSLWKAWERCERDIPTPGIFIDWLQLLHIAVRKDLFRTWAAGANDMSVRPSSVARLGKRLMGAPLSEYDEQSRRRIFGQFLRRMLKLTPSEVRSFAPVAPPLLAALGRNQGVDPVSGTSDGVGPGFTAVAPGTPDPASKTNAPPSAPGATSNPRPVSSADLEMLSLGASWVC